MSKQVSFISPFYNVERYIIRFLDSIMSQTYQNIQIILIDDGSKDDSTKIVEAYVERLKERFSEVILLHQNNGGAACAVNNALKYVKGEYLAWADSDDELLPYSIEKRVNFLDNHPDCGMVVSGAEAVSQDTGKTLCKLVIPKKEQSENIFYKIILGIPAYSGVFMIRSSLLFDKLHDREIAYNSEAGQNYQLLLPVAYDSKCGYIDDVLYRYYIRSDSHSHNTDYLKELRRIFIREELIDNITVFLPSKEKEKLKTMVYNDGLHRRFSISFTVGDRENNDKTYKELLNNGIVNYRERLKHIILFIKPLYHFVKKVISK